MSCIACQNRHNGFVESFWLGLGPLARLMEWIGKMGKPKRYRLSFWGIGWIEHLESGMVMWRNAEGLRVVAWPSELHEVAWGEEEEDAA